MTSISISYKMELIAQSKKEKLLKMQNLQRFISNEQNELNRLQSLESVNLQELKYLEERNDVLSFLINEKKKNIKELQLLIQKKIDKLCDLNIENYYNLTDYKVMQDFFIEKQRGLKYDDRELQAEFINLF